VSMSTVTLTNDCTMHEPTVVYDPNSNRFVLFYVQQGLSGTAQNADLIKYRTSTDGVTWTATQSFAFGVKVISAVSAACSDPANGCLLSYTPGDSELPVKKLAAFTVSSGGTVTIGTTSTPATYGNTCRHYADAAGVFRRNGATRWATAVATSGCNWNIDRLATNTDSHNPLDAPFDETMFIPSSVETRHHPALAMVDSTSTPTSYVFYQKE